MRKQRKQSRAGARGQQQSEPARGPVRTAKKRARASDRAARRRAKVASRAAERPAAMRKAKSSARSSGGPMAAAAAQPALERPSKAAAPPSAKAAAKSAAKAAARTSKVAARQPAKPAARRASTHVTAAPEAAGAAAGTSARSRPSSAFGPSEADSLEVAERQLTMLMRTSALLGQETSSEATLDRSSYLLLYTLDKQGPATISTLAAEVCLAASTVTRQVATMCAAGLVASEPAADDRRAKVVTMQPHGNELFTAERGRRRRLLRALTGNWTEDEWNQLAELLARLNASLGELFDGAPLAYQR